MAKNDTQELRREGRATIYFPPSLKTWLEENGKHNGRSLSSHVAYLIEQYAKDNGYVEPKPEESANNELLAKIAELLKGVTHDVKCYCM